ncbi:hypothetical protein Cch01nite_28290 [Cellulomonas chitinilytica]|uniref:NAD-dependent epimerase/dehydratase domain-containing protein n=1 Tax=Cellulomonas chitinilytica TaxID=398759 RepID=A0A919P3M7_9CELL|nr:hypothetical protein Cch01nite_28290 [Cellulomonas chitinilytica]
MILGGTGAVGFATAMRLRARGWRVDVTARGSGPVPAPMLAAGVAFHELSRSDTTGIERLVGAGADLLVDAVAFTGSDVRRLLPVLRSVSSTVLISSRAVYVDDRGRHVNGAERPDFAAPVREDNPTLDPAGDRADPFTREGYAPCKVAAEHVARDSGLPVTVVRPAKIHGAWARNPRTRPFVERMLRGDPVLRLRGADGPCDHLSAAANLAALVERCADVPGARVLNGADPGTPTVRTLLGSVGAELAWQGDLQVGSGHEDALANPWDAVGGFALDTTASTRLGYAPVGTSVELVREEVRWLRSGGGASVPGLV